MRIADNSGHTLAEILAATVVVGMIFVIVGSLYATSVKLLNSEVASRDVDSLLALETMTRNINLAEESIVDPTGRQLQLRNDPADPATPLDLTNDRWSTYRFTDDGFANVANDRLRTRTAIGAPVDIDDADADGTSPQVVQNLAIDPTASRFLLVNPTGQNAATVVEIRMVVIGNANEQNRTLSTRVALRRSK